jgi:hypothetical protein
MSQMTIAARLDRAVPRTRARVVDAAPSTGNTGYRLLCVMLVALTFTAMLLLNTARAEGSYVLMRLSAENTQLHDQKVTLQAQLGDLQSAETLAASARKLDMVPSTSTATLRLSDGSITGVASKVEGDRAITGDLPATGVAVAQDD